MVQIVVPKTAASGSPRADLLAKLVLFLSTTGTSTMP